MPLDLKFSQDKPATFGNTLFQETFGSNLEKKGEILEKILKLLEEKNLIKTSRDRVHSRMCLDEALVNAILHGNKRNPQKNVHIELFVDQDKKRWGVRVEDEGSGFEEEQIPSPDDPEALLKEGGRGVLIIKNFMDELTYYDRGSGLFMVKEFE